MARSWSGAGAALGGAVWTLHALLLAGRPTGCVREACSLPGASVRPSEDLAPVFLVAVVLLAGAVTARGGGAQRPGRTLRRSGANLLWAGAALLLLGLGVNAELDGDSPLWWLHDTDSLGRLVPVAGSFLVGLALLRERAGPLLLGAALAVGALVSLPFNAQDGRVLLNVPLGMAWALLGCWWLLRGRRTASTSAPMMPASTARPDESSG